MRPARRPRLARTLLALSALAALPATARAAGEPCERCEPAVVEVRVGRVVARTLEVLRAGEALLLPLRPMLELAELPHRALPGGALEVRWRDAHVDTIASDGSGLDVPAEAPAGVPPLVMQHGEAYVEATTLGALLGAAVAVDWRDLLVRVDGEELPIARRLRREALYAAFRARTRASARAVEVRRAERPALDGLVLDYTWSAPVDDPVRASSYSLALGSDAFGGSLEATLLGSAGANGRRVRTEAAWVGAWSGSPWLAQLRLGDASTGGLAPRPVRGVYVGNVPYVRESLFGSAGFRTQLPPGWTVEAYRGGVLVAVDSVSSDGELAVDLPVQYGENPVDFVAYGPSGERRTFNRTYRVLDELLPAGRLEYAAAGGECKALACRGTANLDVRYGLSPRWTVRAGMDRIWRDSLADLWHPYVGVAAAPSPAWGVQLRRVHGAATQGGVRYEPSLALRLSVDYARFDQSVEAPLLTTPGRRARWGASAAARPLGAHHPFYVDLVADRIESVQGTLSRVRLGSSTQRADVRLMPHLTLQHDAPVVGAPRREALLGLDALGLPRASWGPLLRELWWRAGLEVDHGGSPRRASLSVARPLWGMLRAELGGMWTRQGGGALTLSLVADRERVRSYSTLAVPSRGPAQLTQFVQGAVVADRRAGTLELVPGPALQRGGIEGYVFLDANANGVRDEGEEGIGGVTVRVATGVVRSDSTGRYRVWDVLPFEPHAVTVDSLTLPSPLWLPGWSALRVTVPPNRYGTVDLPIVEGRMVEGRVLGGAAGARHPVGGVRVLLRDRDTGVVREAVTFGDGEFSIAPVPPGRYELTVDVGALERLGLAPASLDVQVRVDADDVSLRALELALEPAR